MLEQILGTFDPALAVQLGTQILLALLLGGIVGLERERHNMPAGVRTFALVSAGACLFTLLSYSFPGGDPARVAAQIVSGVGFLGAGVMIQRRGTIRGLTTAAGIWAVSAVGMAVGTKNYFLAVFGALSIYLVLAVLRRWFKADVIRTTRRTLNTALRQVRDRISTMGHLVERALQNAVRAVLEDDHALAQQVIEQDERVNELRYRIEEECLDILRAHHPRKIQLRTVLAAAHVATNLERIGDYAKEIARIRLQMGHESLLVPLDRMPEIADWVCGLIEQVVTAFGEDDIAAAERIGDEATQIDLTYQEIVGTITERMSEKKTRHFERGVYLLNVAYHLKRAAERVTNIAERIIFVRTGALAELDRDDKLI